MNAADCERFSSLKDFRIFFSEDLSLLVLISESIHKEQTWTIILTVVRWEVVVWTSEKFYNLAHLYINIG